MRRPNFSNPENNSRGRKRRKEGEGGGREEGKMLLLVYFRHSLPLLPETHMHAHLARL